MLTRNRISILMLACLALSCASAGELARRSEQALHEGDYDRAYKEARLALDKESGNARARAAMSASAFHLYGQFAQRIRNLAAVDSVQAADASLELDGFRAETARYRVSLPEDPEFRSDELAIRAAAARHFYGAGARELKSGLPKQAYHDLVAARRYVPGYRDLETLIPRAFDRAQTTVAVLPFSDQSGVPGLSRELADHMSHEIGARLKSEGLEFTRLVSQDRVYSKVSVAQLGDLDRADAIEIGRAVGARLVVRGRTRGLRTDSNTDRYHSTIFHRVIEHDSSGTATERYEAITFDAVRRERTLSVHWDFEIIDTDDESTVADGGNHAEASVATVYTDFVPAGDCGDYFLVSPRFKSSDPDGAKRADQEWKTTFGAYTVPKLLERAKRDHSRRQYRSEYRSDFIGYGSDHPIFLDDLPSAGEMAFIALDGTWHPIYQALRDLDSRDLTPREPAAETTGVRGK